MNKLIYVVMGIVILLSAMSCRNNKQGKNYNAETWLDQQGLSFINAVNDGSITEVKASALALTKSGDQQIVRFAKMIVDDHFVTGDELKKITANKNVIGKDSISKEHLQMLAQLTTKKGKAFDKAYIQMMVIDHEKSVQLFKEASTNTSQDIQNFIQKNLPTVQTHLDSANKICSALK
ncbi:hypothetical protein BH09BAC6_BH09BAC6_05880 [soil metagenome]